VETYYSILNEDDFLRYTKEFVEQFCEKANKDGKEFIMLDQFIGSNNPERYLRYVDDIKAIIVDRDPRDVYISRVKVNDRVIPKDPHQFCIYYRGIRTRKGQTPKNCLEVHFEDMIYNYESSAKKFFNPDLSIRGTKLWEKHPEFKGVVKIIENNLKEYLYRYE